MWIVFSFHASDETFTRDIMSSATLKEQEEQEQVLSDFLILRKIRNEVCYVGVV